MSRGTGGAACALAAACLLAATPPATGADLARVAIGLPAGLADPRQAAAAMDAAVLLRLVLSLERRALVVWNPPAGNDAGGLTLAPAPAEASRGSRLQAALAAARRSLERLPRAWRRRSLKRLDRLGLGALKPPSGDLLLDALRAEAAGDPTRAEGVARRLAGGAALPLAAYAAGAALLEAGRLSEAAALMEAASADRTALPAPLGTVARAAREAASGRAEAALDLLDGALGKAPSLAEARWLRASILRSHCPRYDAERILADLHAALGAEPCCPACAPALAEMEAFTARPDRAAAMLGAAPGCAEGAADSARDRALALALAADGRTTEAMEAAGRAESRDASALRSGLAPAFLLAGDAAHLQEAYDSEADLRLPPEISIEHHLHSGLAALWTGRPSEAALQFERAEEHARSPAAGASRGWLDVLVSLKIRAYLAAGRAEEARRAAADERSRAGRPLAGLPAHTAALADLAAGDRLAALNAARSLTTPEGKLWRHLLRAEVALADGEPQRAWRELSSSLQRVGSQMSVCPGVPTDALLLEPQARALVALGRAADAERILGRLHGLGARGVHAPDAMVPAWILAGRAREMLGDPAGAAAAYDKVIQTWGDGEPTPAVALARERLRSLAPRPAREAAAPETQEVDE